MTVGGALIVYAMTVGFAGPLGVRRATWTLRAPRLGAAALVAAAWSVPVAFLLAGLTVILPAGALAADLGQLVGACLVRLRAAYATPAGAGIVTAGQLLTAAVVLRTGWAGIRLVRRRREARARHRLLVRLAGSPRSDLAAVVLDVPRAAAYSVAGRRQAVVVTSGALERLSGAELAAVLAHERAHLTARHHRVLTAAALVAQALPVVPLLREVPARVARLLEMDADELAAAHHEPRVIASALVAVSGGGRMRAAGPPAAAEAGSDAVARIQRLLRPPARMAGWPRALARAGVAALTLAPLVLVAAPIAISLI